MRPPSKTREWGTTHKRIFEEPKRGEEWHHGDVPSFSPFFLRYHAGHGEASSGFEHIIYIYTADTPPPPYYFSPTLLSVLLHS